jgi:hypothetical protein
MLEKIERSKGGRPNKNSSRPETGFRSYLREIGLDKSRANEAERIGAIPTRHPSSRAGTTGFRAYPPPPVAPPRVSVLPTPLGSYR